MIKIELHDGLYWDEHSDYIVGNKQGLMELKNIIDKAITSGEANAEAGSYFGKVADYLGIRCLPEEFFANELPEILAPETKFTKLKMNLLWAALTIPFLLGLQQIFNLIRDKL
jgi:hypothetical protein